MPTTRVVPARPGAPSAAPGPRPPATAPAGLRRTASALGAALVCAGLLLAGCGSGQAGAVNQAGSLATATPSAQVRVSVPDVVGMRGDLAAEALRRAGLTAIPTLTDVDGEESVWRPSNWSVTSQSPAAGTVVPADRAISLMVNHDAADARAAQEAQAEASRQAAQQEAAQRRADREAQRQARGQAAQDQADPQREAQAEASRHAREQSAGHRAAAEAEADSPEAQESGQEEVEYEGWEEDPLDEEPVEEHYDNCSEARAAGAAPLYQGDAGYRPELDRDRDGIACEVK